MERTILNFIWKNKNKKIKMSLTILYNKRTSEGISITDLKLYYRAIVTKNHMVMIKKQVDQWNRIEELELIPHTYACLIFYKEDKMFNGALGRGTARSTDDL